MTAPDRVVRVQDCQGISFQALITALQHPALTSDCKMVCSMLQCCKSWQAALQQCTAGNLHISLTMTLQTISRIACFAAWLPQHAGLVGDIILWPPSEHGEAADACRDTVQQLLVFALQQAAPGLHLRGFTTHFMRGPQLLQALPTTLASLNLQRESPNAWLGDMSSTAMSSALGRLTGLRELTMFHPFRGSPVGVNTMAAIAQLTSLTKLELNQVSEECDLQQLPQQLQQLSLSCYGSRTVALSHVTALQQLTIQLSGSPAAGSALPTALTALTISSDCQGPGTASMAHLGIPGLKQLRRLSTVDTLAEPELLQQLSRLQHLEHLAMEYDCISLASRAATAWQHLPRLCALTIDDQASEVMSEQERAAVLEGLSAATNLTRLDLYSDPTGSEDHGGGMHSCVYLSGMRNLQHLNMTMVAVLSHMEMLHSTSLTALTHLQFEHMDAVVDDVTIAALACNLKQLRELQVLECRVRTAAVLPVIAALSGLTALHMTSTVIEDMLPAADLAILTTLTGLRRFECDLFDGEAVDAFWDDADGRWRPQLQ